VFLSSGSPALFYEFIKPVPLPPPTPVPQDFCKLWVPKGHTNVRGGHSTRHHLYFLEYPWNILGGTRAPSCSWDTTNKCEIFVPTSLRFLIHRLYGKKWRNRECPPTKKHHLADVVAWETSSDLLIRRLPQGPPYRKKCKLQGEANKASHDGT